METLKFEVYCIYRLMWQNIPEHLVLHERYREDVKSKKKKEVVLGRKNFVEIKVTLLGLAVCEVFQMVH